MDAEEKKSAYPSLYQVNTRAWLTELTTTLGRRATLDDITDTMLSELKSVGFDWIWFLSVWSTGERGRRVSREHPSFRREFEETLPDLSDSDIAGSGFSIACYDISAEIGGEAAMKRLRDRSLKHGLKIMLDFVPNHMGPDHPWTEEHPSYFVSGSQKDLDDSPMNYCRFGHANHSHIFAFGRDPYFEGWPDTLQLDYSNPSVIDAMTRELIHVASQCDGVRCDMAMLILPEVFERTWGRPALSFWPSAIEAVRNISPTFLFIAEVYWGMEWSLLQQGFDYAYDKQLYDRLLGQRANEVVEHLWAALDYQNKMVRFLENHDEARIAATMELRHHEASAVISYFSPGLRFFHDGQFEGQKKRLSPHLIRRPKEAVDIEVQQFYIKLLRVMRQPLFRDGQWQLLQCIRAWEDNCGCDCFLAFGWQNEKSEQGVICVNYAPHANQCFIKIPFVTSKGHSVRFVDQMSDAIYEREVVDVISRGLYIDIPAWAYHVFQVTITDNK